MNYGKRAPTRFMLDEAPLRALALLRALGIVKPLRAQLAAHGYTERDHVEGWQLLFKASGYSAPTVTTVTSNPVDEAIRELGEWDDGVFRRSRAALERLHPAQAAFVFEGLDQPSKASAELTIAAFLDRLDTLERTPERKAMRKADHAALETLAARGITPAERTRLRALLDVAQSSPHAGELEAPTTNEKRDADLAALRAWYDDWTETARTVVKRRDFLIRMGLAKRRVRKPLARGKNAANPAAPDSVNAA